MSKLFKSIVSKDGTSNHIINYGKKFSGMSIC